MVIAILSSILLKVVVIAEKWRFLCLCQYRYNLTGVGTTCQRTDQDFWHLHYNLSTACLKISHNLLESITLMTYNQ